mmetsp:Transcript_9807/g.9469  ORF Transcript_9807/g.9469 Transcript_9807/m.9469 type:complete len:113 (-) Transcript_9807:228-566(-)
MLKTVDENDEDLEEGTSVAILMVRDAYVNYVVQISLDVVAEGEERYLLLEELNRNAIHLISMKHRCLRKMRYLCSSIFKSYQYARYFPSQRGFTFVTHIVTKLDNYCCKYHF